MGVCLQRYWYVGEISALWQTELYPKYKSRQSSNLELRAFSVTLALIISPGRYLSLMDWKPKETLLLQVCRSAFFLWARICVHSFLKSLTDPVLTALINKQLADVSRCLQRSAGDGLWVESISRHAACWLSVQRCLYILRFRKDLCLVYGGKNGLFETNSSW